MLVSFLTVWAEQRGADKDQFRLLLEDRLIRVYTVCYSICSFWINLAMEIYTCLNFRKITANFMGVQKYKSFNVVTIVPLNQFILASKHEIKSSAFTDNSTAAEKRSQNIYRTVRSDIYLMSLLMAWSSSSWTFSQ